MLQSRALSVHNDLSDVTSINTKFSSVKTPGRGLKGRAGLQENQLYNGAVTSRPKEKNVILKTPYRPGSKIEPGSVKLPTFGGHKPLVDKTPAPNRQLPVSPLQRTGKIQKLPLISLIDDAETTSPSQPPSSSRKKLRVPRTSTKIFETPITKGDHWNVSDISIDIAGSSIGEVEEDTTNDPDYSDPEYMPPKAKELPYEPGFEMPDYTKLGKAIMEASYSYPVGEDKPPPEIDGHEILASCNWSNSLSLGLNLRDIEEDDPFTSLLPPPPASKARVRGATVKKAAQEPKQCGPTATPPVVSQRKTRSQTVNSIAYSTRSAALQQSRPATSVSTTTRRVAIASKLPTIPAPRPMTSASRAKPSTIPRRPLTRGTQTSAPRPNSKEVDVDVILRFGDIDISASSEDFRFDI